MSYGRDRIELLLNEFAGKNAEELGPYLMSLMDRWWEKHRFEDWERALILYYAAEKWNDFTWDFKRQFVSYDGMMSAMNEQHRWKNLVMAMRYLLKDGHHCPFGIDPLNYNAYRLREIATFMGLMSEEEWLEFADEEVPISKLRARLMEKYRAKVEKVQV